MLVKTSVFLNLLRRVFWSNMWSILKNVPWAFEKNVNSAAFGWNVLRLSVKSVWSNVSLSPLFPCWMFVWMIYSVISVGCHNCILWLYYPLYVCWYSLYMFRCTYIGCVSVYRGHILLWDWPLYHYVMSFFVSCYSLFLKSVFFWYKYCYPSFSFLFPYAWNCFPSICVQSIFLSEVGLS